MSRYKKLLRVLLILAFEDADTGGDILTQTICRYGFKHGYVTFDETTGCFTLSKKGAKFINQK